MSLLIQAGSPGCTDSFMESEPGPCNACNSKKAREAMAFLEEFARAFPRKALDIVRSSAACRQCAEIIPDGRLALVGADGSISHVDCDQPSLPEAEMEALDQALRHQRNRTHSFNPEGCNDCALAHGLLEDVQ